MVWLDVDGASAVLSERGTHAAIYVPTRGDVAGVRSREVLRLARDAVCGGGEDGSLPSCRTLLLDFANFGLVVTLGGPKGAAHYWLSEGRAVRAVQAAIDAAHADAATIPHLGAC